MYMLPEYKGNSPHMQFLMQKAKSYERYRSAWVNIGSGCLTVPEPKLIDHQCSPVAFTVPERNFIWSAHELNLKYVFGDYTFKMTTTSLRRKWVNSSPPSAAYMRQWIESALVQIIACRLFGAKPLSKPMLGYCQFTPLGTNFSENFNQNTKLFIHENASENVVCEMSAILFRGRWV